MNEGQVLGSHFEPSNGRYVSAYRTAVTLLGQPKSAPAWYRDRGPSDIEKQFSVERADLAILIECAHWFGHDEKHARHCVNFILKDARQIIELNGQWLRAIRFMMHGLVTPHHSAD